jgi:hypothetical protein
MTDESASPWARAGFPHGDWLKVLGLAGHRMAEADEVVKTYSKTHNKNWDFAEFNELNAKAKAARKTWESVLAGEADAVGVLFPDVLSAEKDDLPASAAKEIGSDRR